MCVFHVCGRKFHQDLYANVVLSGGTTMFAGIGERMTKESGGPQGTTIGRHPSNVWRFSWLLYGFFCCSIGIRDSYAVCVLGGLERADKHSKTGAGQDLGDPSGASSRVFNTLMSIYWYICLASFGFHPWPWLALRGPESQSGPT